LRGGGGGDGGGNPDRIALVQFASCCPLLLAFACFRKQHGVPTAQTLLFQLT
jgi:hypothetical protein